MTDLSQKILAADKKYAQEICNDVLEARRKFLDEYTDQILDVAKKYNYAGGWNEDWVEVTKNKGGGITDYDKIMETYLWLSKTLFNKSCLFEGYNGARFSSYILGKLRDKLTKINWLRSKRPDVQGVTVPQKTGYIPKCIEKLGEDYEEIFNLLYYNVAPDEIPYKLDINEIDFRHKYEEIVSILAKAGKLLLIQSPTFKFVDDKQNKVQLRVSTDPENQAIVKKFNFEIIPDILRDLTQKEYRLLILYWHERLSAKSIYESFSRDEFRHHLKEMSITSSSDISNRITRTAKKCQEIAINKFPDEQEFISRMNMRNVLKIYFQFFHEEKN